MFKSTARVQFSNTAGDKFRSTARNQFRSTRTISIVQGAIIGVLGPAKE